MRLPANSAKFALALVLLICGRTARAQYAAQVIYYNSTGANPNFADPSKALGPPSTLSTPTVPDNSGIVTIGPGGSLIVAFASPLRPDAARMGGYDFIVFGNAFYVGGSSHIRYQKPAIVEVGVDANHNGYDASDPFYVLQGSPNPMSGYPFQGVDDRQFTTWGYANVTPTDGTGDPQMPSDPFLSGITPGSAGGDAFRLNWAVDALGLPVTLDHVDFIRIRTAGTWPCAIDAVAIVRSASTSVSGIIALDSAPNAVLSSVQVELRNPGTMPPVQTFDLTNGGAFTLSQIPPGRYDIAFKGANTLRRVIPNVDLTQGALSGLIITLEPGDANGDNVCDTTDFNAVVGAYGATYDPNLPNSVTGYDPAPDFNGDGTIDTADFNLLVGSFGNSGDL